MNKLFTLLVFSLLGFQSLNAQEYVEVAVGASYSTQSYYSLSDNNITPLDNQAWDLAFMLGATSAGVLLNESTDLSLTGPSPELKLYITYVEDFSNTIDETLLTDSLYNEEANWNNGAFNRIAEATNPFDFGWGIYNPANHVVEGLWVYALQLRDGSWKKIKIESLNAGVYTMRYADLDGANEVMLTIDSADYDSPMTLFSFDTGATTASPSNWDLVFERYLSPIPAGVDGAIIDYPTVGILTYPGLEVAQASGIIPEDALFEDYAAQLSTENDIIGYDWKSFNLGALQWEIQSDLTFFVKMTDSRVWQLTFIDFEGSSTGNMTFEKTDLGIITSVNNPLSNFKEAGVFPNPIEDQFTLSFTLKQARQQLPVQLVNSLGQTIWKGITNGNEGLNVVNLQKPNAPAGYYQLVVGNQDDVWTSAVILK